MLFAASDYVWRTVKICLGFIFLILGFSASAFGSWPETLTNIRGHVLNEPLSLALVMEIPDFGLTLDSKTVSGSSFSYKPNVPAYIGIGVDYGSIGFTVSTKIPGSAEDVARKGNTDNFDFTAHHSWINDELLFFYEDYKGFYIDNSNNNINTFGGSQSDTYATRSDLQLQHFGINFFHAFKESYRIGEIAEHHVDKIIQSGSIIGSISFNETILNGDQPLVTGANANLYGAEGNLTYGRFLTGSPAVGYGYVWAWTNDFLSGLISAGAGPQWQWLNVSGDNRYRVVMGLEALANLTYIHNFGHWLLGATVKLDSTQSDLGSLYLTNYVSSGLAFLQSTF